MGVFRKNRVFRVINFVFLLAYKSLSLNVGPGRVVGYIYIHLAVEGHFTVRDFQSELQTIQASCLLCSSFQNQDIETEAMGRLPVYSVNVALPTLSSLLSSPNVPGLAVPGASVVARM